MIWLLLIAGRSERGSQDLSPRMETHWNVAAAMEAAAVRGDLETVRDMAGKLASLPFNGVRSELRPRLEQLRSAASALSASATKEEAVTGVAGLAGVCADCHVATGGGPVVRLRAYPPIDCCGEDGMVLHQWAADWLWLGLVAPSTTAWDRGARELGRVAPDPALRDLAARAVGMEDRTAQVKVLGDIFLVCARCHSTSR